MLERLPGKGPPCETDEDGCPKGHWRDPVEISDKHWPLIESYHASRASGGASLTEAERMDAAHMHALGRVDQLMRALDISKAAALVADRLTIVLSLARGRK